MLHYLHHHLVSTAIKLGLGSLRSIMLLCVSYDYFPLRYAISYINLGFFRLFLFGLV
jgi:hypothetical protein